MTDSLSLDSHCVDFASPMNAFSLQFQWEHFKLASGEGQSRLIHERAKDEFIPFCEQQVGGFAGKSVLELGPYEGYHSCGMANAGAKEIISIEANPRNFLKCLIVKNHYRLDTVNFLLGNFTKYLQSVQRRFDFILAAGVLYHLSEPFLVLDLMMQKSDSFGICTTYYDPARQAFQFTGRTRAVEVKGARPFILHERHNPPGTVGMKHGIDQTAWMFSLDDLLRFLDVKNFDVSMREMPDTGNRGPRTQLFAKRRPISNNIAQSQDAQRDNTVRVDAKQTMPVPVATGTPSTPAGTPQLN